MKNYKNKSRGFTLIETLLSVVIATIIIGSVVFFFLNMLLGKRSFVVNQELEYNTQFAVQLIQDEIRQAAGVNQDASIFDLHPGTLSLISVNLAYDPIVISSSGSDLSIQKGVAAPLSLISNKVTVSNLEFSFDNPSNTPGTVTGTVTFQSIADDSLQKTQDFSVTLRTNNS